LFPTETGWLYAKNGIITLKNLTFLAVLAAAAAKA